SQWLNEKFKLGLDFPNLPYLIDGSHKITQSNAILRYIARKHNLCELGWLQGEGQKPSSRFTSKPIFAKMAFWNSK
uniref:glutathione transferase n=1 Tax=Cricetulus griseus TaxID=10029 RepID=A0A8C2M9K0_CRIGR